MESNQQDAAFARLMIPHHQAAIVMAQKELASGVNGDMRTLAQNIITAQTKEITMLQDWLTQRGAGGRHE